MSTSTQKWASDLHLAWKCVCAQYSRISSQHLAFLGSILPRRLKITALRSTDIAIPKSGGCSRRCFCGVANHSTTGWCSPPGRHWERCCDVVDAARQTSRVPHQRRATRFDGCADRAHRSRYSIAGIERHVEHVPFEAHHHTTHCCVHQHNVDLVLSEMPPTTYRCVSPTVLSASPGL